ncbi:hypothetical protein HYDPIDRAFT_169957 [Hydnomerulius pinastri MD-312]|uniref:Protein HRI1 n=1 Tax=Hydnomerulius pinastri MD-312 TaxID=994086 RepID=A0A0C9WB63_9AGAM|nr:hypothetical protein HYDPIDRAFT_169957 [Hydnomerulius pinastri MD-312]
MTSSTGMYGEPFISVRETIAWLPGAPFEDSDVLVLSSRSTSPGVGGTLLYLDLRLSLPLSRASITSWGLAGLRHTLSVAPDPVRHRWDHATVDSRGDPNPDEGEVVHRDGRDIETGVGVNPATGNKEPYEEIWRDEPLLEGSPFIFVTSSRDANEATAFMAVLGPHALALSQESAAPNSPKKFHAVRMHQSRSANEGAEPSWNIVFSTSNQELEEELGALVGLASQEHEHTRGSEVSLGLRRWAVWDAGLQGASD